LHIVRTLRQSGHIAYFAGGCVRDQLLGHAPKDYDVATDAEPTVVRKLFKRTQAVGQSFGVVLVRDGSAMVEVATFRSDGTYDDGRRPNSVSFTTPEFDAQRRDFTVNGLFLDPIPPDNSVAGDLSLRVIDFVGGQADLKAKLIRAIGRPQDRFAEDHLRMMRAARFAARLGFTIEPSTAQAVRQNAHKLARISPERVGDELRSVLMSDTRGAGFTMLVELGLAKVIFRHVPSTPLQSTPLQSTPLSGSSGRSSRPTSLLLDFETPLSNESSHESSQGPSFGWLLAAMWLDWRQIQGESSAPAAIADAVSATARGLRQSLRLSNDETDAFVGSMAFASLVVTPQIGVARLKRFLAAAHGHGALELLVRVGMPDAFADHRNQLVQTLSDLKKQDDFNPDPLITGADLIAMGFTPGPAFKRALDDTYDRQLEGRLGAKADAIQHARTLLEVASNA